MRWAVRNVRAAEARIVGGVPTLVSSPGGGRCVAFLIPNAPLTHCE
jgi:hypothetical protein